MIGHERILSGQFSDHLAFYGLPGYAYLLAALLVILPATVRLLLRCSGIARGGDGGPDL